MMVVVKRDTGPVATSSLRITTAQAPDGYQLVALAGAIDENADLEGMFAQLTGDTILNMRSVDRLNSMGVHRWVPFVSRFSARHRLVIEEISYAVVQNANAVANLFGSARVRSCMAPYYCSVCKDNCTMTVTVREVAESRQDPPPKRCLRCATAMEFDELDGYFSFFKSQPVE